jgi:ATP-dependent Clp protease ATP-binding subunit ClpA
MNGYNFTEQVRQSLAMAREEAVALYHPYVGPEHELLGLLRAGDSVATVTLQNLGVDLDELRDSVLAVVKAGRRNAVVGPDLPYTSRAKKVLELCMSEARELNHNYCGSEHLLMGLLREKKGIAAQMLGDAGVTIDNARAEILEILRGTSARPEMMRASPLTPTPASRSLGSATVPRYAERLRSVLAAAHDVAKRQKSAEITPAHAAIALLEHRQGVANAALQTLDFRRDQALAALEALTSGGTTDVAPDDIMRLSSQLMSVLQLVDARNAARGAAPGTHHLLLGILAASPDVAGVFAQQRITEEVFHDAVTRVSG